MLAASDQTGGRATESAEHEYAISSLKLTSKVKRLWFCPFKSLSSLLPRIRQKLFHKDQNCNFFRQTLELHHSDSSVSPLSFSCHTPNIRTPEPYFIHSGWPVVQVIIPMDHFRHKNIN
ncbi:hypothetical protein ILYODFUR_036346 [Ilyodon furcidens]|uniref:Uncharacterized protein n=1 Tax=Ilyodon furcidens TaxID=33524 RepID=A0ABV0V929_9TELE